MRLKPPSPTPRLAFTLLGGEGQGVHKGGYLLCFQWGVVTAEGTNTWHRHTRRRRGGIAPQICAMVSHCKSASAPSAPWKIFLWRLWRLVFPMPSGPIDRSPQGGVGVQGGGRLQRGGVVLWGRNTTTPKESFPLSTPPYHATFTASNIFHWDCSPHLVRIAKFPFQSRKTSPTGCVCNQAQRTTVAVNLPTATDAMQHAFSIFGAPLLQSGTIIISHDYSG